MRRLSINHRLLLDTLCPLSLLICCSLIFSYGPSLVHAKGWESLGNIKGVKVSRKTVEGSNLFAFRGEVDSETPIDQIIHTFADPKQRKHWVDRYHKHTTFKKTPLEEVYWIHFKLPPLISDRDYILKSVATVETDKNRVSIEINSLEHPKDPKDGCCVRAQVKKTYYQFEALSKTKTRLIVEVHTDPKGLLPGWVVNLIQKSWPSKTLNALIKQSRKVKGSHAKTKEWLEKAFP